MDLKTATVDEIATFKQAAAARYIERGVPARLASQAFDAKMAEVQAYLAQQVPNQRLEKIASAVLEVAQKLRK